MYKEIQVNKSTQVCGRQGHWFIFHNGVRVATNEGLRRWWTTQHAAISAARGL